MKMFKTKPEIPPHKIMGLVKFGTTKKEFLQLSANFIKKMVEDKTIMPFQWDQIQVVGTVDGEDILELRFIKFD